MNDPGEAIPFPDDPSAAVHHLIENFQPIFSASQQRILQGSAKSTAVFSFLGSCLIIRSILKNRRSKMKKVYHRLMLAISSVDCLTSMTFLLSGPWIIPSVASFMVPGARGSFQACEASGFFLNMLMASMWYSLFMALYFLLTINFQWKEERMARLVEPAAHGVSLLVPLVLGVRGVLRDEINPFDVLPGMCWFMAFPPNCAEEGNGKEDCIRGHTTPKMLYQVMFVFIGILGSMIAILCKVRSTEVRLQRYSGGNSLDLTRQTGTRALLYIVAFLLTYSPMVTMEVLYENRHQSYFFYIALVAHIAAPMQGFLNALIYMRKLDRSTTRSNRTTIPQTTAERPTIPTLKNSNHVEVSSFDNEYIATPPAYATSSDLAAVGFGS